jgi:hypothetical protein
VSAAKLIKIQETTSVICSDGLKRLKMLLGIIANYQWEDIGVSGLMQEKILLAASSP